VQGHGQLDNAEIGAEVAAGPGERLNQELANLLRQIRHLRETQALQIGGRMDGFQQCSHVFLLPEKGRAVKQKPPALREFKISSASR
jgi:ABC-type branched-subunit amino acid transport system ATPase component